MKGRFGATSLNIGFWSIAGAVGFLMAASLATVALGLSGRSGAGSFYIRQSAISLKQPFPSISGNAPVSPDTATQNRVKK